MLGNRSFALAHPKAWIAFQVLLLSLIIFFLVPVFSGSKRELFLAAVLGAICTLCIIQKPHWGVLVILATWFIEIDVIGIRYFSIPYLVSAILVIPLGSSMLRDRGSWLLRVPQVRIFLIIGLLFLLSTWWSEFKYPIEMFPEHDETIRKMQLFFTRLVFLAFFVYFIRTRQKIELAVWLTLGLISVAAVSSFLQDWTSMRRAVAAFSLAENSNRLAYISLFGTTVLWFYRSYHQKTKWNALTLLLLLILPLTALSTGSRSGFLQLVALGAVIIKEQEGWAVSRRLRATIFVGCIAALALLVTPTARLVRITSFDPTIATAGQKSLQHRIGKIYKSAEMIASDPLFGIGIGNFKWVGRAYYGGVGDPHNSYLWALATGGIGVFILYLHLFHVTYRMLTSLERDGPRELLWLAKAIKVNLILFLIFSAFADFWLSDFLYLIVGSTIAMRHLGRDYRSNLVVIPFRPAIRAG